MKLRTRLVLAFLLLSVLPLTGVTLYSYTTSIRAFRQSVEAESREFTDEMGRRMELVTRDLGRRIARLGDLPYDEVVPAPAEPDVAPADGFVSGLVAAMGESAALLHSLEFVPRGQPLETDEPDESFTINLSRVLFDGDERGGSAASGESAGVVRVGNVSLVLPRRLLETRIAVSAVESMPPEARRTLRQLGEEVRLDTVLGILSDPREAEAMAERIESGIEHLTREVERRTAGNERIAPAPAHPPRSPRISIERDFAADVRRDGRLVGTVKANVDGPAVLAGVLSRARRDQGEIPFAIDSDGNVFTPAPEDEASLSELDLARLASDAPASARVGDNWMVVMREEPSLGLTFGIARPVRESLQAMQRATARNLAYGLAMIGVAMIGILPLSRRITRPLSDLTAGAQRLAGGDLDARVPVRSSDEIGVLGATFNRMAADLGRNQERLVEQERLRKELEMCRQIQEELLPRGRHSFPFAEVRAVSIPARELGGDFFNYFTLPDGSVALLMGDVSGKGVPAALLMANLQATLRARLPLEPDLARLARLLDREIEAGTPTETYLTLFVGVIDAGATALRYVSAGHNTQYLVRGDGSLERLRSSGRPLGLLSGGDYTERRQPLGTDDALFLYTDGVVEAENEQGHAFGERRLEDLIERMRSSNADGFVAGVERAVRQHRGQASAADDATLLVLRLGRGSADASVP